jgi:hypothetical protein
MKNRTYRQYDAQIHQILEPETEVPGASVTEENWISKSEKPRQT